MPKYVLQLYVTGQTQRSLRAAANLRRICDEYLGRDYDLTLIDVKTDPELAEAGNILATPVTLRVAPPPPARVVGDLSDAARVLTALGIELVAAELPTDEPSIKEG